MATVQTASAASQLIRDTASYFEQMKVEIARMFPGRAALIDQIIICLLCQENLLLSVPVGQNECDFLRMVEKFFQFQSKTVLFCPEGWLKDGAVETKWSHKDFSSVHWLIAENLYLAPPGLQLAIVSSLRTKNSEPSKEKQLLGTNLGTNSEQHLQGEGKKRDYSGDWSSLLVLNPLETEITQSIIDPARISFFMNSVLLTPSKEEEFQYAKSATGLSSIPNTSANYPRLSLVTLQLLQDLIKNILIPDYLIRYAVDLIRATRPGDPHFPKGFQDVIASGGATSINKSLIVAAKARALMYGRLNVTSEDIREVLIPIMRHQILPSFQGQMENFQAHLFLKKILQQLPAPHSESSSEKKKRS